jgi:hypothetical protein
MLRTRHFACCVFHFVCLTVWGCERVQSLNERSGLTNELVKEKIDFFLQLEDDVRRSSRFNKLPARSAHVSIRQHTSARITHLYNLQGNSKLPATYVSIRQHTSSYVSIRILVGMFERWSTLKMNCWRIFCVVIALDCRYIYHSRGKYRNQNYCCLREPLKLCHMRSPAECTEAGGAMRLCRHFVKGFRPVSRAL